MTGSCLTCAAWKGKDTNWGHCHRKAPEPYVETEDESFIDWPRTHATDVCWEYIDARECLPDEVCNMPSPLNNGPCRLIKGHKREHFNGGTVW